MAYDPNDVPGGFTLGKFLTLGAILTIAIILGIKYLINENSTGGQPAVSDQQLFKAAEEGAAPRDNPARRPESYSSGGALDMFTKANETYSKDTGQAEESAEADQSEVEKDTATAPARTRPAAQPAAAAPAKSGGGTVIPKLKPVEGFSGKGKSGGKNAMPGGMPDVSSIINGAMKGVPSTKKDSAK
ncbi:MAG TPA: hypothetical protein DCZ92_08285 [Elusimicrobia bacterium]|nr:MAG: hypothetical protein A2016_09755 [Elusimicrobia bacterium GWF2_62_30]HBA60802.1 hypothetical protein [Elusimicrobiota bacterium]